MEIQDQLEQFAQAVIDSPHNLVSRAARDEVRTRHVPESVAFARYLPAATKTLVDVGSGGGFPGVLIALVRPDIDVHLVESVGKKARFLAEVVRSLGVNATVHHMRVEEFARLTERVTPDAVSARAVASLRDLAALTAPLLVPGGFLYAIKGAQWQDELEDARATLERVKLRVYAEPDHGYEPETGALPRIVVLQKA